MRNEYREIILESRYKRDWYTELWMAFKSYPHCSKIGAMTHISNNLAARLSTGVLQRKWRMRGRGALSIVHRCTSKLVATYPSHFCANGELAGTGVYFNMEECLLCCNTDILGWWFWYIFWAVWLLLLTDPHFQFVLLLDSQSVTFTQSDILFAFPSIRFHLIPFQLFLPSRPPASFLAGQHNPYLLLIITYCLMRAFVWCENWRNQGWLRRKCWCGVCVHLCRHVCVWKSDWKQPIEIAVCHVVPEWRSVRSRDAVTSCPHHHWSDFVCQRDLQDIADVNTSPS